jgi:hypothetical protein
MDDSRLPPPTKHPVDSAMSRRTELLAYDDLPRGSKTHIRILELYPGHPGDSVRCGLYTALLSAQPYEALSYCWGDPEVTEAVTCNNAKVQVTVNLAAALQALRRTDQPRLLWVDALCINQSSITERNEQVAIMRDIYNTAATTIVWLGDMADDSDDAMALVPDLIQVRAAFCGETNGAWESPNKVQSIHALAEEDLDSYHIRPVLDEKRRTAFLRLLDRPWFSRVWVVQETVMARKTQVFCGTSVVGFNDLCQASMVFNYLDLHDGIGIRRPLDRFYEFWDTGRKHAERYASSLFTLAMRHRQFQATDPRDKLYALSGIANDASGRAEKHMYLNWDHDKREIRTTEINTLPLELVGERPDYGVDVVTAYTKFATKILQTEVGLDVLSAIHPSAQRMDKLPSWVPDWSISTWYQPFRKLAKDVYFSLEGAMGSDTSAQDQGPQYKSYAFNFESPTGQITISKLDAMRWEFLPVFRACGETMAEICFSADGTTLHLSGTCVDTIEEIGLPGAQSGQSPQQLLEVLGDYMRIAAASPTTSPYRGPEGRDAALIATMLGGHINLPQVVAEAQMTQYMKEMRLMHELDLALRTHQLKEMFDGGRLNVPMPAEVRQELEGFDVAQLAAAVAEYRAALGQLRRTGVGVEGVKQAMGVITGRRFARGSGGWFVLAPDGVEKGDQVVLFKGGRMPCLLRGKGTKWEMLGDCYVHGAMHGEMARRQDGTEVVWSEFEIV